MSGHTIAADDIVATRGDAASNAREPLLILEPLIAFLDAHALGSGPPEVAPVGDGHSNVTYLVHRGEATFVLRRPPRGPLPPSAHDVLREARLLRALGPTPVRVPRVLAVCADPGVIGAPFYAMEYVPGAVIAQAMPGPLDTPERRRQVAEELVDALVELHAVDWSAAGLDGFGRPTGYLERQVRRFLGLWEHNRTREVLAVERVGAWLAEHLPGSSEATVVHGDYRLGNTAFGLDGRLAAIFDWEMATIGDPLADVGYLSVLWVDRDDPPAGMFELSGVTRQDGFPSRDELVALYEQRSGRAMTDIRWYQTMALWKAIVFMEGNYRRAISGSTDDPYLKAFGDGVLALAERAEAMALGGG